MALRHCLATAAFFASFAFVAACSDESADPADSSSAPATSAAPSAPATVAPGTTDTSGATDVADTGLLEFVRLPDGRAGFTTDAGSFKVKRMRRNPAVTLRPCDLRGRVAEGATSVSATAVIVEDGPDHHLVHDAVAEKYGIQFTLVHLGGKLKRLIGRDAPPIAAVVLTFE